jgi:hypothetical protein
MSCQELTAMTPAQVGDMDKADIITEIFESVTRTETTLVQESGNNVELTEIVTDAYEVLLGSRLVEWTYYGIGEVDEVTVTNRDDEGATTGGYTIKHYRDGRQPTMSTF